MIRARPGPVMSIAAARQGADAGTHRTPRTEGGMRTEPHARSHTGARDEGTRKGNEGSRDRRPGGRRQTRLGKGPGAGGRASGPGAWAGRAGGTAGSRSVRCAAA
ncbi:hypothetical protein GCM10010512_41980 [Streptomyces thermoviolaceus subsp. thermoviolaceus]|nr:hypothetical protein GCM10010512_41980 [Streptomyces thermoviolaceus subsp. thermoviolaceus]